MIEEVNWAPSFTVKGHGNDQAVKGKEVSELPCLFWVREGNPSKGTKRGSEEWDSISPLVATGSRGNHERPCVCFRRWEDIGVEVCDEGFIKPPKVVGGTSVTFKY